MGFYINTNMSSINSMRNLSVTGRGLDTCYERLSSGLRINRAKDDASGLQISNRMGTEIDVLTQGNRNANDCVSMCQVIEGALDEVTNMLQRMRTLAVQSRNGTNSDEERSALDSEFQVLSREVMRVGTDTTYGSSLYLFEMYAKGENDNALKTFDFQVGADGTKTVSLKFLRLDELLEVNQGGQIYGLSGDYLEQDPSSGFVPLDVLSDTDSDAAIDLLDTFLSNIDSYRSNLGAMQSRMEASVATQENIIENLSDSRSRIRDADYARETASMARYNVLQQAATSILTQANQRPEAALGMLQ